MVFRGVVVQDPTMTMLAMTILIHFWVVYWNTEPHTPTLRSNLAHYNENYLPTRAILGQPAGYPGSRMVGFVCPNRA